MRASLMAAVAAVTLLAASAVSADDWTAVKLRGSVFVWVDEAWQPLKRGDVVSDYRNIQTGRHARVVFQRGSEIIELGPDTQVQIVDQTGRRYTTVHEHVGTVTVEAEVQNVEHFEVRTPNLAAVVKGTRFTVQTDNGGSEVEVRRGNVAVQDQDTNQTVVIAAGQSAETGSDAGLHVDGRGNLPAVLDASGRPVQDAAATNPRNSGNGTTSSGGDNGRGGANSGGGNSSSGGNGGGNGNSSSGGNSGNGGGNSSSGGNNSSSGGGDSSSGGGNGNSSSSGGNGNGGGNSSSGGGNGGGDGSNGNGGGNGHNK